MKGTTKSTKETRELIYLTLLDHDGWVTSQQLGDELGMNRDNVKAHLLKIKREHPNVISNRHFGYKIVVNAKNSEGYYDPTAKAAIDNVSSSFDLDKKPNVTLNGTDYDKIIPGTLWETTSSGGKNSEYFFVIASRVNGIPVAFGVSVFREDLDNFSDRVIDVVIDSVLEGKFLGDVSCLKCKPMKYFKRELTIMKATETLKTLSKQVSELVGNTDLLDSAYNHGYSDGVKVTREELVGKVDSEHQMALAENYQRGLRDGQKKGYDIGFEDGKREAENKYTATVITKLDGCSEINNEELIKITTERDMYKMFYNDFIAFNMKGRS